VNEITELKTLPGPGERMEIHLDGSAYRTLPARIVLSAQLVVGAVLTDAELAELDASADQGACMDAALGYLSYRARSGTELRRHLRKKYAAEVVDQAVQRCLDLGYVDDRGFAESFARDRIRLKPRGSRRIVSELRARGVSETDAKAGVEAAFTASERTEADLLQDLARRRWQRLRQREPAVARRRLTSYLLRRGFAHGEVRAVVDRLFSDAD